MTQIARRLPLVATLLLAACATPQGRPLPMSSPGAPKPLEFRATGEFRSSTGQSAAFDEWRVVGPTINMTRNPDGSWDGTAGPRMAGFHLDASPGAVEAPNFSLRVQRTADGYVELGGLFFRDRYLIRISPRRLQGSTHGGHCSFELDRVSPELFVGDVACGQELTRISIELLGEAARVEDPVLPQAALALVAVLP